MRDDEETASRVDELVARYPVLGALGAEIRRACGLLIGAFRAGRKLLVCGNGGSAADADHIVGELMKSFVTPRPLAPALREKLVAVDRELGSLLAQSLQVGLPSIALTGHAALSSAFGNDVDSALIYAQQLLGYATPGDIFWGISTSGNAKNVLNAAVAARALGLTVIAMTGSGGGALAKYADILLAVPERETYKVQELHLPVYHTICLAVEAAFFPRPEA
jgi:D-sedoheptulose 7-phosphate isomerase